MSETPSISDAIMSMIDKGIGDIHTAIPGTVVSYNPTTQISSIRANVKRLLNDILVDIPVINNVPVVWPRVGTAWIHMPLVEGSQVLLVFCERSIDTWKTSGGQYDPGDVRRHHLTDAVAIPGCYPFSQPMLDVDADAVQIVNGLADIRLYSGGTFKFGNKAIDLLSLFDQALAQASALATQTAAITVNTAVGPSSPPNNAAAITAIQVQIDLIKTQLAALLA